MFGVIWTRFWNKFISSPQAAKALFKAAFYRRNAKFPVDVKDVFCVPDYEKYLHSHIRASRFSSEELTQHQWTFEAITQSEEFPSGVKVTYRMYCASEFIDIVPENSVPFADEEKGKYPERLVPVAIEVHDQPQPSPDYPSGGTYTLLNIPQDGNVEVADFVAGSRAEFEKCLSRIRQVFSQYDARVVEQWEQFDAVFPQSDNAREFLQSFPRAFYLPFRNSLFAPIFDPEIPLNWNAGPVNHSWLRKGMLCAKSTAITTCVRVRGQGEEKVCSSSFSYLSLFKYLISFTYDMLMTLDSRALTHLRISKRRQAKQKLQILDNRTSKKLWNKKILTHKV